MSQDSLEKSSGENFRLLEQNLSEFGPYTYGFFPGGAMGYGLLRYYGLWSAFPCEPTRWTQKGMGYMGVWVMRAMA